MRYALIDNSIVTNLISLSENNASDFPTAVKIADRPVAIGDNYQDGKFYHDGVEVLTPLEQAQAEIAQYKTALKTLGVETEEEAANEN